MKSKKYLVLVAAGLLALVACNNKPSSSSPAPSSSGEPSSSQVDPSSSSQAPSSSSQAPSSGSSGSSSSSAPSSSSSSSVAPTIDGIAPAKEGTEGIELAVGETGSIAVVVSGTGDFNQDVLWSSENPAVASVAADGVITGVAIGETNVIAKAAGDQTKSLSFKVEVVAASIKSFSLNRTDVELEPDDTFQLLASVKTRGTISDAVTFASSNEAIAEVDETGKVTANAVGDATITATSVGDPEKEAKCYFYVREAYVKTISLSADSIYLRVGEDQTLNANVSVFGEADDTVTWLSSDENIATVDDNGKVTGVAVGNAVISAQAGDAVAECEVIVASADSYPVANGSYSYVYSSGEVRQEILGKLEKWAVENKLTGLTLYGNGAYVMYNDRVVKGTNNYLPGYGFGIFGEGQLTSDLAAEQNADWKRYYHTIETSDPSTLQYMNDKGSVVGDLIAYVSSSYFDTQMNAAKTGYKWVNFTSESENDRPIPVDLDADTGMAKTYKIPLKVGDAYHYSTLSKNAKFSKYNNQEVALEDYVTPYKIYYTQSYGLARSAENLTKAGSIAGSEAYYNASKAGFNAEAWENIGIKTKVEDGKSYIIFTFNQACTPFYAMYYLSSGMFAPVPEQFIKDLGNGDFAAGVKNWGNFSNDGSLSPVDTFLSTGPYVVERWDKDQQIVFKKSENYENDIDDMRYEIAGIHFNIFPAAATDNEAAFKEFLDGRIDAASIPSTKLAQYKDDPRTTVTSDSTTYKLNMNTCTKAQWELLFGENGSIVQTPKSQYWNVKPAMSNKDFLSGISFALNRKELAETLGRTATANFFGASYMQDPENGISYNSTQAHADAVASLQDGTDGFGYSLEKAKAAFLKASQTLIAEGAYKAGDTIEIQFAWQTASDEDELHKPIAAYLEKAFEGNPLKIKCVFWTGAVWSDVYYKKMMIGQFDIGMGSVSGNTYNPLNFMEVLKSDNSSTFTLNWGIDTNSVDGTLVFDNKVWSYDALWTASDQGAYVEKGQNSKLFGVISCEAIVQDDGSVLVYLYAKEVEIDDDNFGMVYAICLYATTDGENYSDYREYYEYVYTFGEDGEPTGYNPLFAKVGDHYEITLSAELIAQWLQLYPADKVAVQGIDVYFYVTLLGEGGLTYVGAAWEGDVVKP